jgi:YafQ family addiction module toxin component
MYKLEIKDEADKIFRKLSKKNIKQLKAINKKIQNIRSNPEHTYKFLKDPLQNFNRIHIEKHFVLVFKINHSKKTIIVYYFDHHDNVYNWRHL